MDSISETVAGALIIEAGASGSLNRLKAIRKKVKDEREFLKICDECSEFSTGRTVLHHAAAIGHYEICKFLIHNVKVYINPMDYKMTTPVAEAVKGEHVKIVEFLIKHDAVIAIADVEGLTPLHLAILKGNRELIELLLVKHAHIEAESLDGTPLQVAVSRGNAEAVKCLLSHGANPNHFYEVVDCPLVCAVKSRSLECMDLLLEAKADPNLYLSGLSPLGCAAKEGDTKFLESLLKAGADPNLADNVIYKPIEEAALVHNRAGVEILFPVTKRITHFPNWTVDGITEYAHSEEFTAMNTARLQRKLNAINFRATKYTGDKNYGHAVLQYRIASSLYQYNLSWVTKRSLCQARLGIRSHALFGARKCMKLLPNLPVPRHGEIPAGANMIFKKFLKAGLTFMMDPYNEVACRAFRVCMYDYFAWLSQINTLEEILSFRDH
ncbi:ankyrin repeat and death domain-containing protein 1B-like isoform X2 [Salvia splendens]|uniref:ankyrin repeat and death domain-containing protein 1B-like isoform X2 n=1 Tax=Salvia splendens TaxID=180675 RepID=UPI001C2774E9|nr:ankyrin repeat and death domain-containing protein 1B-like isoform X2 [Salvia splendens]